MTQPRSQRSFFGHYAGPATRAAAFIVDWVLAAGIFIVAVAAGIYLLNLVTNADLRRADAPAWVWTTALVAWLAVYFGYCWAMSGKTPGAAVLGVRIVRRDGSAIDPRHALIRVLTFPLGFLTLGLGFLGIALGREHRALYDVIADTTVVYDWRARTARLSFLTPRETPGGGEELHSPIE
jgi:uncharacterized RDD family membrane protein YckC